MRRQLECAQPVLARQGLERGRAPLQVLLARGIDVERLQIAAQGVGGFAYLDGRIGEELTGLRQRRIGIPCIAQRRLRPCLLYTSLDIGILGEFDDVSRDAGRRWEIHE